LFGGYAVNYYGYDRNIDDLDIVIDNSRDNVIRFMQALDDIRMGGENITIDNLMRPNKRIPIDYYNIEVFTSLEFLPFDRLYFGRVNVEIDNTKVSIISRQHLLSMKKSSSSFKDINDYKELIKISGEL